MCKILIVTGLIGSGKSTVVKFFKEEGIPTLDADAIAHQLYENIQHPLCQKIISTFGSDIVTDNHIDRKILRSKLHSKQDWEYLESLVNPLIQDTIHQFIQQHAQHKLIVIEISVFNSFSIPNYDTILVQTSLQNQIERVKQRSQLSEEEILFRINKQKHLLENIPFTHIINNNSIAITKQIVKQIILTYP